MSKRILLAIFMALALLASSCGGSDASDETGVDSSVDDSGGDDVASDSEPEEEPAAAIPTPDPTATPDVGDACRTVGEAMEESRAFADADAIQTILRLDGGDCGRVVCVAETVTGEEAQEEGQVCFEDPYCTARAGALIVPESVEDEIRSWIDDSLGPASVTGAEPISGTGSVKISYEPATVSPMWLAEQLAAEGYENVAPVHMVGSAQSWGYSPDDAPRPIGSFSRDVLMGEEFGENEASRSEFGSDWTVYVVDTGLVAEPFQTEDLIPVPTTFAITEAESDEDGPADANSDTYQDWVFGHGTFVGGIVSRLAPSALLVFQRPALSAQSSGEIHEPPGPTRQVLVFDEIELLTVIDDVATMVTETGPQNPAGSARRSIVNISLGFYVCGGGAPSTALTNAYNNLVASVDDQDGFIVSAAGNQATEQPFYPAAWAPDSDRAISVGATDDPAGQPYSNNGSWVEVLAQGDNIESIFPWFADHAACAPPAASAAGVSPTPVPSGVCPGNSAGAPAAAWTGTSFAAPCVTAYMIAVPPGDPARIPGAGDEIACWTD